MKRDRPMIHPTHSMSLNALEQAPIGIFDSGVGGLTVLKAIARRLPHESLLYFGDTARLPYGTRSQSEIIQFVREILTWMQSRGTKMVVMACNTSSALALDHVRDEFDLPVLGVILPAARIAARHGKRIGVIATPATAASRCYTQAMRENNPAVNVWEVGCPEFVPIIESNRIYEPETMAIVASRLQELLLHGIDTLIYGCTHYPHLKPVIDQILSPSIIQVDPAVHVAEAIAHELHILGLANPTAPSTPVVEYYVSHQPERFGAIATQWLGHLPQVEQIVLAPPALTSRPVL
ncbi:MAG: glutamate racemase [Leptolyngbyaceae bacterium]|nr:glutamate racemase [Leptolyngbyaceae bacterium]